MNSLKENIAMGLLVALSIGPSLSGDPSLSLVIRLSSAALIALGMVARWISEAGSQDRSGCPQSVLGKEARSS
jgi:hypothetical protein